MGIGIAPVVIARIIIIILAVVALVRECAADDRSEREPENAGTEIAVKAMPATEMAVGDRVKFARCGVGWADQDCNGMDWTGSDCADTGAVAAIGVTLTSPASNKAESLRMWDLPWLPDRAGKPA
jgi:hypothetical protein